MVYEITPRSWEACRRGMTRIAATVAQRSSPHAGIAHLRNPRCRPIAANLSNTVPTPDPNIVMGCRRLVDYGVDRGL